MELLMKLALLAACALNFLVQSLYFVHMLQLNSYRGERYRKWCRDNDRECVRFRRILPVLIIATLYLPHTIGYGVSTGILLLTAFLNLPKKAKKPLVFTPRVWRLLATLIVLLAAVLAGGFFLSYLRGLGIVGLASIVIWVWVGIANFINTPLEKGIADRYVRDARRKLEAMPELVVIGITGSYGKTSVKNFLYALLSVKYNVLMTPESYNTTMGVVRTIREQLRPSHEIFLVEMGAKQPGDIREICELVHPRYGVITAIGEQHLETFETIQKIIATKFELADAIPSQGCVFLNGDNPYIRAKTLTQTAAVYYGTADAAYTASDMTTDTGGMHFLVTAPDGQSEGFTTRLLGAHNQQNLTGCIAVAHSLGIPLPALVYAVRLLKPVPHRLQLLSNGYIDDAYNANPAGFRSALEVLKGFAAERVLVTPGMVELGERQEALNRELGVYAADCCDYAILVGEKQAPPLLEGLLSAGFAPEKVFVAGSLTEGLAHLQTIPAPSARIVLLENDLPDNF